MKKYLPYIMLCLSVVLPDSEAVAQQKAFPRIGIAGISIECSTFSPAVTPLPGPEMIVAAKCAGLGGQAEAVVGAMEDHRFEGPVKLSGTVMYTSDSEAVVKAGSVLVIVTKERAAYHYERGMTAIGLNPRLADIVIVKQGYLVPDWYNMQADWMMAHTRGGVDQNLVNLPYKRIVRPMYPMDANMPDPELNVIFVPSAKYKYGR